jgi:plasmid stabilization system protein ParE
MPYQLLYFDAAKDDIRQAKNWYKNQAPGLEKRFSLDIKTAILRLAQRPFVHAIRYKDIRVAHPDVFPFAIHYYIDESKYSIVIIAIVHNSRNPFYPKQLAS